MEHQGNFDYILLETTGLADPGNIAPLFWLDDGLGSSIFLDGIVTLVDAKNVLKSLDEGFGDEAEKLEERKQQDEHGHEHKGPLLTTAHLQISHADVVLINKTDLVSEDELKTVVDRVRSINGLAKIKTTNKSQVPQLEGLVLDLHAYDQVTDADLKFASKGHSHLDPVSYWPTCLLCHDPLNSNTCFSRPLPPRLLHSRQFRKTNWMPLTSICAPFCGKTSCQMENLTRSSRFTD